MSRDYKKEYREYHAKPEQKKRRAGRNAARRYAVKKGMVSKGDGREVDHKNYNANDNRPSNLRIVSAKTNRSRQPKRTT